MGCCAQNMVDLLVASDIKYQNQNISLELYRNEEELYSKKSHQLYHPKFFVQMDQAYRQEIWARVDNLTLNEVECLGEFHRVLQVNPLPRFTRTDLTEVICTNIGQADSIQCYRFAHLSIPMVSQWRRNSKHQSFRFKSNTFIPRRRLHRTC